MFEPGSYRGRYERHRGVVAAAADAGALKVGLDANDELIELEVVADLSAAHDAAGAAERIPVGEEEQVGADGREGSRRSGNSDHSKPKRPIGRRWRSSRRRCSHRRRTRSTSAGAAAGNIDRRFFARRRSAPMADPAESANATALTVNKIRFMVIHFLISLQDRSSSRMPEGVCSQLTAETRKTCLPFVFRTDIRFFSKEV